MNFICTICNTPFEAKISKKTICFSCRARLAYKQRYIKNREKWNAHARLKYINNKKQIRAKWKTLHPHHTDLICKDCGKQFGSISSAKKRCSDCHKRAIRTRFRQYYNNNRENIRIKQTIKYPENYRKYYNKIIEYSKRYYEQPENIIKRRNRINQRLQDNPQFKVAHYMRQSIRYILRKQLAAKVIHSEELCGCAWSDLVIHLENQFKEGMTWKNHGKWHIDHIKPCASFDLTDTKQLKECCHYTNLQPLWAKDNLSKSSNFNSKRYYHTTSPEEKSLQEPLNTL